MEYAGVISRMDESTEWCASIVVVPKSQGEYVWIPRNSTRVSKERGIFYRRSSTF